ncbi:hypothetical protein CHS0354_031982 [Potamilus streckersoni]|uniref:Uncharacterized protein n=1 Tax=Potamilus streckersoni TaxID=2493646 RepID=A0AAE0TLE6_9BIVA|nr:hypothetical protein CHS0354_031982 [Potamilus streckersoni]
MKSLIVFAVAILVVSVQGSEIIQENLDYEHMYDDGRDYISVDDSDAILDEQNLEELQDIDIADEVCQFEGAIHLKCEGKTCKTCDSGCKCPLCCFLS